MKHNGIKKQLLKSTVKSRPQEGCPNNKSLKNLFYFVNSFYVFFSQKFTVYEVTCIVYSMLINDKS